MNNQGDNHSKSGQPQSNGLQSSAGFGEALTPEKEFLNLFNDVEIEDDKRIVNKIISSERKPDDSRITFDKLKVKLVRESENICEKDQQLSLLKFTKTASQKNLSPKQLGEFSQGSPNDFLVIKSDKKISNEEEEENEEIHSLKEQIKHVEKFNDRIKEENMQLRLQKIKMSSDSDTMQIISLKMDIKELKKKIELLKKEKKEEIKRQNQSEEESEGTHSKKKIQLLSHYYRKGYEAKTTFKHDDFQTKSKQKNQTSFKNSFGSKNLNSFSINDKSRHSNPSNVTINISQFGLAHVKSTEKLVSSNQVMYAPSTPTVTPTNPSFNNNHLFNSQFYQNQKQPPVRYEYRNEGFKSPQTKKYYRK